MNTPKATPFIALPFALAICATASAQLTWRVSIKVIRDENGNRAEDVCWGGSRHGQPCSPHSECTGGVCLYEVCSGGLDDGNPCDPHVDCPPDGARCIGDLNTDVEILSKIDAANAILSGNGPAGVPRSEDRGYRLELVEDIIDLYDADLGRPPSTVRACSNRPRTYCDLHTECEGGTCVDNVCDGGENDGAPCNPDADCGACVGGSDAGRYCTTDSDCSGTCTGTASCDQVEHWFYAPITKPVRKALRGEATVDQASKDLWHWRDDALNIYILGTVGSGTAWQMILLGQRLSSPNTPFHEVGHFFDLYHTHGDEILQPEWDASDCVTGWDDAAWDTLDDNCGCRGCWGVDQIADWAFRQGDITECGSNPCTYLQLSASDQHRVDQVYHNVMSYREERAALTPGQLDRMTDYSNGRVHHVTNGFTHFVDVTGDPGMPAGSSTDPYATVNQALIAAGPRDIVLLRRGTYHEVMMIDQHVTLRASGGHALIGGHP